MTLPTQSSPNELSSSKAVWEAYLVGMPHMENASAHCTLPNTYSVLNKTLTFIFIFISYLDSKSWGLELGACPQRAEDRYVKENLYRG